MVTTNYGNGVTNNSRQNLMGYFLDTDSTLYHQYFNDFDSYTAANWTVTATDSTTQTLTNVDGGVLLATNSAANADSMLVQKNGFSFSMTAGVPFFFKARFAISDSQLSEIAMGLSNADGTNAIVFSKISGASASAKTASLLIRSASVNQTIPLNFSFTNAVYATLGFYYDGQFIKIFGGLDSRNPTYLAQITPNALPVGLMTPSFTVVNGEAVAKTMSIDYILVAKERI